MIREIIPDDGPRILEISTRERIAQLDGVWRDTVLLERRSKKTGNK
jgi:L-amino acid N-acyltransferase YncA